MQMLIWLRIFLFVEAILNDTQPAVTGKDGREAVKLVEMGNLSIKTKNIVRL